jgi:hypothetical protein
MSPFKPLVTPPRAEYDDNQTERWRADCRAVRERQARRDTVWSTIVFASIFILTSLATTALIWWLKRR